MDTNELAPGEANQTQSQPAEPGPAEPERVMTTETEVVTVGSKVGQAHSRKMHPNSLANLQPITTSERGAELAHKKWDTIERVAEQAMADAAGVETFDLAVYEGVKAQYILALSGKKGSTPAYIAAMRTARAFRERAAASGLPDGVGAVLMLSDSAVAGLAAALAEHLAQQSKSS